MFNQFSSSHSHSSSSQVVTENGKTVFSSSSSNCQESSSTSLSVRVVSASELYNAQTVGKQDPFAQFSLNYEDKKSFVKTFVHKNAGRNASWDQSFTLPLNGEPNLYVEVLDEESTVNEVIGFAAIPINQIVHAQGANLNGLFNLFTAKGAHAGTIHLQLAALGFPNSQPADLNSQPVEAQSFLDEGHCARMKSTNKKAQGVQIGGALLGGALAVGAGFLGKKLYDNHKAEKAEEEEAERLRLEEEEAEKARQEQEESNESREESREESNHQSNYSSSNQGYSENRKQCEKKEKRNNCDDSDSDSGRSAKKWNPVGTYAAGDRVKYNGRTYMCLQGHTSNPTWQPGAAHSLWQAE